MVACDSRASVAEEAGGHVSLGRGLSAAEVEPRDPVAGLRGIFIALLYLSSAKRSGETANTTCKSLFTQIKPLGQRKH